MGNQHSHSGADQPSDSKEPRKGARGLAQDLTYKLSHASLKKSAATTTASTESTATSASPLAPATATASKASVAAPVEESTAQIAKAAVSLLTFDSERGCVRVVYKSRV